MLEQKLQLHKDQKFLKSKNQKVKSLKIILKTEVILSQ